MAEGVSSGAYRRSQLHVKQATWQLHLCCERSMLQLFGNPSQLTHLRMIARAQAFMLALLHLV